MINPSSALRVSEKVFYYALIFTALGIFTSVSIASISHILGFIPLIIFYLYYPKSRLPKSIILLGLFVLWCYFSSFMNLDELTNPTRSFGKMKYPLFGILMALTMPVYTTRFLTADKQKLLLKIFFTTIILSTVLGLLQVLLGFEPLNWSETYTSIRNPGLTGVMRFGYGMGMVFVLLLGAILYQKKLIPKLTKPWLWISILFAGIGILSSQCRGAVLGVVATLPLIFLLKDLKKGLLATLIAIILLGLFAFKVLTGGGESRFFTKFASASILQRLSQYEAGITALRENPIIGLGFNEFSSKCPEIKENNNIYWYGYCSKYDLDCETFSSVEKYCSHAHNIFIETGANTGLIGLVLFSLWLLIWFFELLSRQDAWGKVLASAVFYLAVAGQFEYMLDSNNSFLIFALYGFSFVEKKTFSTKNVAI